MDRKLFQKNKFTFFIIIFFLVIFILLIQVRNLFFPDTGVANYGDRLDGLTQIEDQTLTQMKQTLQENESVKEVSTSVAGRILNVIITVNDDVSLSTAKTIGESTTNGLGEDLLKQYDVQVFIQKDSEAENDFPIIGYRSKLSTSFSWTRDREKTTEEEPEE